MAPAPRERIVLDLPADPRLAALARMVALHFLHQHGIAMASARVRARAVERRIAAALRSAARGRGLRPGAVTLLLTAAGGSLEIAGPGGGPGRRLRWLRLALPRPA